MHAISPRSTSSTLHTINKQKLNLNEKLKPAPPSSRYSTLSKSTEFNSFMFRSHYQNSREIDIKKGLSGSGKFTDNSFKNSLRSYPIKTTKSPSVLSTNTHVKDPVKILRCSYVSTAASKKDILNTGRHSSTRTNTYSGDFTTSRGSFNRRYGTSRDFGIDFTHRSPDSPILFDTAREHVYNECLISEETDPCLGDDGANLNEKIRNIFNLVEAASVLEESLTDFNAGDTTPSVAEEHKSAVRVSVNKTNMLFSNMRK